MPERKIEQLADTSGSESFTVLAEWLRTNRETLEDRLDSQDKAFGELKAELHEIKKDGKETKAQSKITNGRVTELERNKERISGEQIERERHAGGWKGWQLALVMAGTNAALLLVVYVILHAHG